ADEGEEGEVGGGSGWNWAAALDHQLVGVGARIDVVESRRRGPGKVIVVGGADDDWRAGIKRGVDGRERPVIGVHSEVVLVVGDDADAIDEGIEVEIEVRFGTRGPHGFRQGEVAADLRGARRGGIDDVEVGRGAVDSHAVQAARRRTEINGDDGVAHYEAGNCSDRRYGCGRSTVKVNENVPRSKPHDRRQQPAVFEAFDE